MATSTATREGRVEISEDAERKFMAHLVWHGKEYNRIGQESWLPSWVHQKIRFIHDDETIKMIRHFPDFDTGKALVQVKSAPNEQDYPSVTIEEDSYWVCKKLFDCGVPVLIVWLFQDGKRFYANWVDKINPYYPDVSREQANGSHTPFMLVAKNEIHPLSEFIPDL